MGSLTYTIGDATEPVGPGHKMICHIVNDAYKWGSGFVVALSDKWPEPEEMYRNAPELVLGDVQYTPVGDSETPFWVANMVAQENTGLSKVTIHDTEEESREYNRAPIRYGALATAMNQVGTYCEDRIYHIHAPRFGAGLAGGHWPTIEALILEIWVDNHDIDVTIYDLEE